MRKYWVGDPCYALNEQNGFDWHALLDKHGFFSPEKGGGFFVENGERFFVSNTSYGDGVYVDQIGQMYPVDAGAIAAIPLDMLKAVPQSESWPGGLGHVFSFEEPLSASVVDADGVISIGQLKIYTGEHF